MLSWQFTLVDGDDLAEYVFLKNGDKDLSLYDAIGRILDHLESCNPIDVRTIRRYKYCDQWIDNNPLETVTDRLEDARSHCVYVYRPKTGFTMERIAGKCKWINAHNTSIRKFKPDNWKNANRPERQANILPFEMIREKLEELQNA